MHSTFWPARLPDACHHLDRDSVASFTDPLMNIGSAPGTAPPQHELHRSGRAGWLRAAVLGADDGIVSTASLMIGVASAAAPRQAVFVAGLAGLVAGAMSMAAGEYVSVSSQRDAERADIKRESRELARDPTWELGELTELYVQRGLDRDLARKVAEQLSTADALETHVRRGTRAGARRESPSAPSCCCLGA